MKKVMLTGAYMCFSVFNSWALATWADSVGSRVGGKNKCSKCDDSGKGEPVNECLHLGQSDPCSPLACISNVDLLPKCEKSDASDAAVDCPTEDVLTAGIQTTYETDDCDGNSAWVHKVIQVGVPPCVPELKIPVRCLTKSCGGGVGVPGGDRWVPRCKKK